MGTAVPIINKLAHETLPQTVSYSFQGAAQDYQAPTKGLAILLIMAIFVIYIVLGILYESFIHPLTILSGLPAAGFGALITLIIFNKDLNIFAFVAVICFLVLSRKMRS